MIELNLNTRKNLLLGVAGILVCLLIFAFIPSEETPENKQAAAVLEVETATPVYHNITEWDEYTGRFEASNRVEVRARVSGFLESVNFTDGQQVEKGQVLFVIDQRPFRIELNQAQATYSQALAMLKTAQDNYNRVESLQESGAVSTEEYDRRKQALVHAEASKELAQAKVDHAQLNLEFTEVKAPIAGLVSRDKVNEGNLIDGGSAQSTLLTTIVATNPIHFYFTGSETEHLKYVRLAKEGKRGATRSASLPVQLKLSDEEDFLHEAQLDFVDNEIDQHSGTIESRAVVNNEDHLLEPGMFGKARIVGSDEHKALMIPDEIIGTNQSLRYVYVLGEDHKVSLKNIRLGPLHSNVLRIVRDGLTPHDQLIVNNIQKIRPGMVVSSKPMAIQPTTTEVASVK